MIRPLAEGEVYFPVTMQQFENIVNEMLAEINNLMTPYYASSDYMAQIVMSALHSMDRKESVFKKQELFDRCVHNVSNHVTHGAVEAIQQRLALEAAKAKAEKGEKHLAAAPEPNNIAES
jgi:hypothetical protein